MENGKGTLQQRRTHCQHSFCNTIDVRTIKRPHALDLYTNETLFAMAHHHHFTKFKNYVNKATSNHSNGFYYAFMAERNDMIRACVLTSSEATCPSKLSGANVVASIANSCTSKPPSGASGSIV